MSYHQSKTSIVKGIKSAYKTWVIVFLLLGASIGNTIHAQWTHIGPVDYGLQSGITAICKDVHGNIYATGVEAHNFSSPYKEFAAKWDGTKWEQLSGLNVTVQSICCDHNGTLYAAGYININGYITNNYLFKWDGTKWNELNGLDSLGLTNGRNLVMKIDCDTSGNLYAVGSFADSTGISYMAKWNGSKWSKIFFPEPTTYTTFTVHCDNSGNVFTESEIQGSYHVLKWDGSRWSVLGDRLGQLFVGNILCISSDTLGNVYTAGNFTNANGNRYVAKWDSNKWSEVGGVDTLGANSAITSICFDGNGNLYAAGDFTDSTGIKYVAKWDGKGWSELNGMDKTGPYSYITNICSDGHSNVYAVGGFINTRGNTYLAKWNGSKWEETANINGKGANSFIYSFCSGVSGKIYTGGDFTNSSGNRYVAEWDGANWKELGGLDGLAANKPIRCICRDSSGNLYAAGEFTNSAGNRYVAKWDGNKWSELGGLNSLAADNDILSIYSDKAGTIYAAGVFSMPNVQFGRTVVAKWNGSKWVSLIGLNDFITFVGGQITGLCSDSSGNICAAMGSYVAKWDGNNWAELEGTNRLAANESILDMCNDKKGYIYAAGRFTNTSGKYYVAKWDGTNWSELGGLNALAANNYIQKIAIDTNGNVYAIGYFSNNSGKYYVAKWDGTSWTELGGTNSLSPSYFTSCVYADNYSGKVFTSSVFPENAMGNTYWAYYQTNPLPLKLISFSAKQSNNVVTLQWQTANEVNTQSFTIERSSDGKTFTTIGTVPANGSGNSTYSFTDITPLQGMENFYRLKMIDKDGSFTYSKIVEVQLSINNYQLSITPNPAKGNAVLHFKQTVSLASIAVYNSVGQRVLAKEIDGSTYSSYTLPIHQLSAGTYTVTVHTKEADYNSKLVVE
ncbi:T9SS type A sorting domain-containing protein [Parasediminibacterium sp. JCM 36343]|uniref:T9SS type A sorting domain-containing protein n=1 Tax=Parasediminibacterium sp. JCM 36343 TaxID=3374279 RepID=UPI00397AEDEA